MQSRYADVLMQLAAGDAVSGATLRALPRLLATAELPAEHRFKPRDVWPLVIDSAVRLAGEAGDFHNYWIAVGIQICAWRREGINLIKHRYGRAALCELGMAADFAGGLDRAGLLPRSQVHGKDKPLQPL